MHCFCLLNFHHQQWNFIFLESALCVHTASTWDTWSIHTVKKVVSLKTGCLNVPIIQGWLLTQSGWYIWLCYISCVVPGAVHTVEWCVLTLNCSKSSNHWIIHHMCRKIRTKMSDRIIFHSLCSLELWHVCVSPGNMEKQGGERVSTCNVPLQRMQTVSVVGSI